MATRRGTGTERKPQLLATHERDCLQAALRAVQRSDLAAVAHLDTVVLDLSHEVVRHGLSDIAAPVKQRDQRAAACEPDGRLSGGVPAADHGDAFGAAELGLGRAGGVEDGEPFVLVEVSDGEAAVSAPVAMTTARAATSTSSSSRTV